MTNRSDLEGVSGLRCILVWPADLTRTEFWAFNAPWFGLGDWVGESNGAQWGHSNDHNSAVIKATELILGMVHTSRPARNS